MLAQVPDEAVYTVVQAAGSLDEAVVCVVNNGVFAYLLMPVGSSELRCRLADAIARAELEWIVRYAEARPGTLARSLQNNPVCEALEEAIAVIRGTKHQSRSKQLGRLRCDLEALLVDALQVATTRLRVALANTGTSATEVWMEDLNGYERPWRGDFAIR